MSININAIELGQTIGKGLSGASQYKQDFVETEDITSLNLVAINTAQVVGSYFIYVKNLGTSAFVIDHPVYGNINSASLHIDGNFISTTLSGSGTL
jgi:hypothetical protein